VALHIGCDAIALRRNGKKLSNAALGLDLVGSDPHFQFGRIAAVSFARRVLREVAKQPRIFVAQRSVVGPRAACYGKDADYYGKDEESRRITAFITNWRVAPLCHHLSPVHSTATSKITKAPGMTRNTTNSKNGEKLVNFQARL